MPIIKGIDRDTNLMDRIRAEDQTKRLEALAEQKPGEQRPVDTSIIDNGYWDRATFTVPDDVPDGRVQEVSDKYRKRAGEVWESHGFEIVEMVGPQVSDRLPVLGRRRYDIFAFVRRKPTEIRIDVPDIAVPALEKKGMKLNE